MDGACVGGLVLAAGAGTRYGGPKALARRPDGTPWVASVVGMLRAAGCAQVFVALGAGADEAVALVPPEGTVLRVADWADGLSATLRAGLEAAVRAGAEAVLVVPVDTPDLPIAAARRVLAAALDASGALVQATYDGRPGHPVLIGARHVPALVAQLRGDRGARAYLAAHGAIEVECADLWSGDDVDRR